MSEMKLAAGPPSPPNGPSDWSSVVRGNAFTNIQRLGLWTGKGAQVNVGQSPSSYFSQVSAGALGQGTTPPPIYVVVHGWAPGYRGVVNQYNGSILWWSSYATYKGRWASDWAWSPVIAPTVPAIPVNPTGMLQQIYAFDPSATVVAYSWIDDSATDSGTLNLDEVYSSEAYTHLNGMRLADALQAAIAPSFFQNGGQLHLIGHSHGSKVCTVAAYTLQQAGMPASRLTIMDSPEGESTLISNAANLLGFYLDQMNVQAASGLYVDNYVSYFGVLYDSASSSSPINNVVEVALNPDKLYTLDPSACHTYAAAWYGGAEAGSQQQGQAAVGLGWPPLPQVYTPAMNQLWTGPKPAPSNQWLLSPGSPIRDTYVYGTDALSVQLDSIQGNVATMPPDYIIFSAANGTYPAYSIYEGTFYADNSDQYGIAFDLNWVDPQAGDYFVVTVKGDLHYTLLVLDGGSYPEGRTSIAINCDIWDVTGYATLYMYFLGAQGVPNDKVTVSNFRYVQVSSTLGTLECRERRRGETAVT